MSREIVFGTAHHYDWFQVSAAIEHPDHGKLFDISHEVNKVRNINHANVKLLSWSGYGNQNLIRELIDKEKPDAIMIFTDPRFWDWLFAMENEIRQKIPIVYYNIWDATPTPFWNLSAYESCDLIMNISKQTHSVVENVLKFGGVEYKNMYEPL